MAGVTPEALKEILSSLPNLPTFTQEDLAHAVSSVEASLVERMQKRLLDQTLVEERVSTENNQVTYVLDTGPLSVQEYITKLVKDMKCEETISRELDRLSELVSEKEQEARAMDNMLDQLQLKMNLLLRDKEERESQADDMDAVDDDVILEGVSEGLSREELFARRNLQLAEGMKLYGQKWDGQFYKGTLVEIKNKRQAPVDRRYRIKFDSRGGAPSTVRNVRPNELAFTEPLEVLPRETVGCRVAAWYAESRSKRQLLSGVLAEVPSFRNAQRALIFFDDGFAQYCTLMEVFKICGQDPRLFTEVGTEESRSFVQDYLQEFPKRKMVKLAAGDSIRTHWKGNWYHTKVRMIDSSLALIYFDTDHTLEWIYRGSPRFRPIWDEICAAPPQAKAPVTERRNKHRKTQSRKTVSEYVRDDEEDMSYRKKGNYRKGQNVSATAGGSADMPLRGPAAAEPENDISPNIDPVKLDEKIKHEQSVFVSHSCSPLCLHDHNEDPKKYLGENPFIIPFLYHWKRELCVQRGSEKKSVMYSGPCGRRLRTIQELDRYLELTDCPLPIDMFSYDPALQPARHYSTKKTMIHIKDLSYSKEKVPVGSVNTEDRSLPDYVEYSTLRTPGRGVNMLLDTDFLAGCDCTDGCRDKSKCSCCQLTVQATGSLNRAGRVDPHAGYTRKLHPGVNIVSGVYECNPNCKCDYRCHNRVVQHGLTRRLEVYKTKLKGWGLRTLDDIPKGGFICVYAGQILTEDAANEDGQTYGDEYLAELDYIEVVEGRKEGYESDVEDEGFGEEDDVTSDDGDKRPENREKPTEQAVPKIEKPCKADAATDDAILILDSDDDESAEKKDNIAAAAEACKTEPEVPPIPKIFLRRTSVADDGKESYEIKTDGKTEVKPDVKTDDKPDVKPEEKSQLLMITEPTSLNTENMKEEAECTEETEAESRIRRSTRSRTNHLIPKRQEAEERRRRTEAARQKLASHPGTRKMFNDESSIYVVDAKSMGNLGRYLNHSCQPNAFVQNVFVDTHDLRFPWVAFFANQHIKAGDELTWDYNYEPESVPGKTMYCYCEASECRGRLL